MRNTNKMYLLMLLSLSLVACGTNQKTDDSSMDDAKNKVESKEELPAKEAKKDESEDQKEDSKTETSDEKTSDKKLPEFTAKDQDGNPFSNEDISKNDATVINLWFTGCSACIEEMDELNDLADELKKEDGVDFVSMCTDVNYDESTKESYDRIIKDKNPTYKALAVDYEGEMKEYLEGIFVYPTTIVVDKNGNIIGDPVEGTLIQEEQKDKLKDNIDKAIESSKAS
ncbi:TlpA disulfide reductase family protein [uncultured Anaerococcus sp.]|uniref:TlpA family protein disulfide reductase n=1 Tax=uncultured Anaerococcus sp. TaxID=293428 RepID=UPI00261BD964|nr:TlpA disulfide reductase family protein [uncultured Anaerococcus sp.]